MRLNIVHITLILFLGCSPSIEKEDLQHLNGYWEIEKVEFPNGQTKEYAISMTIDYIKLDGMSGFRKKVQPQLNGSYRTSDDAEHFDIIQKNEVFKMVYGLETKQREEKVILIDENSFAVRNQDDKIYIYKRYKPLNLEP